MSVPFPPRGRDLHLEAHTEADGAVLVADVARARIAIAPVLMQVRAEDVGGVEHHGEVTVDVVAQKASPRRS